MAQTTIGQREGQSGIGERKEEKKATEEKKERVAVIGLGYVGLPLALLAEEHGYPVMGIDIDQEKLEAIRKKDAKHLSPEESAKLKKSKMEVYDETGPLSEADVVIVCVPTPVYEDHTPNFEPLKGAIELTAAHLRKDQLILVESTINPGVCEEIVLPILEKESGLQAGEDFFFAHCPERINPGVAGWDVATIPRVIGANDAESLKRGAEFYRSILNADVYPMQSLKEAEAVKIVENSFRDINIAFVNELAMSFDRLGIDIVNVIKGASTKPFAFMAHFPGCGVGGHCIPVDPYYLITYAAQNGFTHRFLSIAREINNTMPRYTVGMLASMLKDEHQTLRDVPIALLGLSYKRDVPDLRESPALVIRDELLRRGALVRTYDPLLPQESNVESLAKALEGAEGVIIATDHKEFRSLTPEIFTQEGIEVVVDGRNCLSKEDFIKAGIRYKGIGR